MDRIRSIEPMIIQIPRQVPYLGPLEKGVIVTPTGYFVRPGNRSVYSIHDQSVLVRVQTEDGIVGWGECVAFVAPEAVAAIVRELLGPLLVGRPVGHPAAVYHDLYDLMRVRGFFGGFYHDTLAAIDIALWDTFARSMNKPLVELLGGQVHPKIPAYVSGLPETTLEKRVALARSWQSRGFNAFKFASAVSHEGTAEEMAELRRGLGEKAAILCDMHWKHTAPAAISLITKMDEHNLAVAEAPCQPEDIEGQAQVAAAVRCPVGIGEELRTVYEFRPRFERRCMGVIQPEMGRTGVTSFMEICHLSRAFHTTVMPHASIGIGIFQAASVHAAAALPNLVYHEYQHSIFDNNLKYLRGEMHCQAGYFNVPPGAGHGVAPDEDALARLRTAKESR
jgi:L-alanine-DL-glutamate epimerase-like enolase superfamily enzyme